MSSPRMNNIIILGCALIYVSGILFGLDSEVASGKAQERVCQVRYQAKNYTSVVLPHNPDHTTCILCPKG